MADQIVVVEGVLQVREPVALENGGIVTVKLVDASGEVLAGDALEIEVPESPFALSYDPGLVPDPSKLLIWAALRTDAGLWGTAELAPVDGEPIVLTRIPD